MRTRWIARHCGTKRDIERQKDFYRIGPELDVADPDCTCPTIKPEWRANQIVNDVNAVIEAVAAKDAEIARLREALELAAKQLQKVHEDAFRQAAGYGLVTTDGREFSCTELNECDTVARTLRAALSPIPDPAEKPVEVEP